MGSNSRSTLFRRVVVKSTIGPTQVFAKGCDGRIPCAGLKSTEENAYH